MSVAPQAQRARLQAIARRAMRARGLEPDFPPAALGELGKLVEAPADGARDLRSMVWCSIDNDDSRDLDQLTVAAPLPGGEIRILVAVADVSALVTPGSAIDAHAGVNTTSIYTPPQNFPMLPERLSTDLSSLNAEADRLAIVVETVVDGAGSEAASTVYAALVRNHAKLAYSYVGPWLDGTSSVPEGIARVPDLAANLQLQDRAAQRLRTRRHLEGALELQTLEPHARFDGDAVSALEVEVRNRAKELIEDFMIASNGAIARFLTARRFPVLRRVVRSPERWARIVEIATHLGDTLPSQPDALALHDFLVRRRAADPLRFPDLSLSVIKLLGRGEYDASFPDQAVTGHFGLAVSDYTHSTAPNRRYPDLITQRLVRAALEGRECPYPRDVLTALAAHCTQKADDAQKVERLLRKATAACLLSDRIGAEFDGIVTGASPKGTWARIFDPPVEGRIEHGAAGLDVGDRVRVKLLSTDIDRGFIDFARVAHQAVGPPRG